MSFVTSLCFRLLSSRPGWEPVISSGGAGEELQLGNGGAGREGDYCGRQQEEIRGAIKKKQSKYGNRPEVGGEGVNPRPKYFWSTF